MCVVLGFGVAAYAGDNIMIDVNTLENTHSRRTLRRARCTDICLEGLRRMCQERVGLTNSSHDQKKQNHVWGVS